MDAVTHNMLPSESRLMVGSTIPAKEHVMSAFGVAHLRKVTMGPAIVEDLERIDATLEPFGGRFILHGGDVEVLEGNWPGHLVVIEFPDRDRARAWYASPAYQEILRCAWTTPRAMSYSPMGYPKGIGRRTYWSNRRGLHAQRKLPLRRYAVRGHRGTPKGRSMHLLVLLEALWAY
jgi:uncharacterized protein (DUF1330 family)